MTTTQLSRYIGKQTLVPDGRGLKTLCNIIDARVSWGDVQVLVTPIQGTGERWIHYTKQDAQS